VVVLATTKPSKGARPSTYVSAAPGTKKVSLEPVNPSPRNAVETRPSTTLCGPAPEAAAEPAPANPEQGSKTAVADIPTRDRARERAVTERS
jgi:hypothetical protein